MTPIQISGTPAEVRRQFAELSLPEDAEICLTVDDMTPQKKAQLENAEMMRRMEEKYANHPRVNGIIQVSMPGLTTLEEVEEALYRADIEDALGENWEVILEQMQTAHTPHSDQKEAAA